MTAAAARRKILGVIAEFPSASTLYQAAEPVRGRGYWFWDVDSPFPIHGMNKAMGLRKSPVGFIIFCGGLTGFLTAASLEFIPSSFLYPLVVHGKPVNFFTVPAFFPIMFELTVLFSAFTAFFGVFVMNRLPRLQHPIFDYEQFRRVTDDAFFLIIEASDPRFSDSLPPVILAEIAGNDVPFSYHPD